MDDRFPRWLETVIPEVSGDTVTNRAALVDELAKDAPLDTAINLAGLLYRRPSASTLASTLRARGQAVDPKFPMQDEEDQLAILAGAACLEIIKSGGPASDPCAAALVSGDCAGTQASPCRGEFASIARQHLAQRAAALRSERLESLPTAQLSGMAKIEEQITEKSASDQPGALNILGKSVAALATAARAQSRALQQLRESQRTFQEDSDILWWLMGRHCRTLDQPVNQLSPKTASVCLGFDLADLCGNLPGPYAAEAFLREMLMSVSGDLDKEYSVKSVTAAIVQNDRYKPTPLSQLTRASTLCPLHTAIFEATRTNGDAWHGAFEQQLGFSASASASALDLSYQAFIERLLLKNLA